MDSWEDWKSLLREDSEHLRSITAGKTSENISDSQNHHSDFELLFSSPSLCPPLLYHFPRLSLSRFLSTAAVPPSASSYIAAKFGDLNPLDDALPMLSYNRLQILPCPDKNSVLMFFPTGSNCDRVGFLLLFVEDSGFRVMGSNKGEILVAKERLFSRIVRILVKPVDDSGDSLGNIGYVMVYTLYSVHWYCVHYGRSEEIPALIYLGYKQFKSCSIASASWSPHLRGECLILLENGVIFLFDVATESSGYLRGNRIKVFWGDQGKSENCCWLGCEFSWHPRIYIAARSDAVFLVDTRSDKCNLTCLMDASSGTEQFLAFSKVGDDGLQFILASHSLLFLCDVTRSLTPLLQWSHDVKKPCYIDVYSLSELKSGTDADEWANGSCVILASFWNSQFCTFYCGPYPSGGERSVVPRVGNDPRTLYARELPYNFLCAGKCCHKDCILRETIMMDSCPDWIDWQKKKEVILGFGVLNKYLQLNSDRSSGFTLLKLTSLGKLEVGKFCFSWDSLMYMESAHRHPASEFDEENLLYLMDDSKYKFPKRFQYLEFNHLCAYINGNISELLDSRKRKPSSGSGKGKSFSLESHEALCEKLKNCGFGRDRISPAIAAVFDDVSMATNIVEIASRHTWAALPTELLLLAYSNCSEFLDVLLNMRKVSLEFLAVPNFPQLPPFFLREPSDRSSRWARKELPRNDLVGPVLPLPLLLTLDEFRNGCPNSQQDPCGFSPEAEFSHQCDQVSQVVRDMAISGPDSEAVQRDQNKTVSLGDDWDDVPDYNPQKRKPFIAYHPFTKVGSYACEDERLDLFISRLQGDASVVGGEMGSVQLELFDDLSPSDLKFDHRDARKLGKCDMLNLKTHFSRWLNQFSEYQDFFSQYNLQT